MPKHSHSIITNYHPDDLFDLVADIKAYPEFLPWVVGARIIPYPASSSLTKASAFDRGYSEDKLLISPVTRLKATARDDALHDSTVTNQEANIIIAELLIKYKIFRSSYISKVTLVPKTEIIVELVDGPFKYLKTNWFFKPDSNIEFSMDFELKSKILDNLIAEEFEHYASKMMSAFLTRAEAKMANKK